MDLFQYKHEQWLGLLFGAFATPDQSIKSELHDCARIAFRHLKWIALHYKSHNRYFHFRRGALPIVHSDTHTLFASLYGLLETPAFEDAALYERITGDERYMRGILGNYCETPQTKQSISAFERHMHYPHKSLDRNSRDALIRFLFEESYKEYELILTYFYMQTYTDSLHHYEVFTDLIDESYFHLQRFGEMMALMGILALPREVHELSYKVGDLRSFVLDGIDEERAAKEECRTLSDAVHDPELSAFFNCINAQESYHIELMKRLL
ncbi:MAG: iron-binding protein [Campylobacterales bacterium]|nr:iron-binding protein [Campylobacterales bacterium]